MPRKKRKRPPVEAPWLWYSRWVARRLDGRWVVMSSTYGDEMRRYPLKRHDRAQAFADLLNREEQLALMKRKRQRAKAHRSK